MSTSPMMSVFPEILTLSEAAIKYHSLGFHPIPCKPKSKEPLIEWRRYQDQPPTLNEVIQWWEKWPDANVGLVMGHGMFAVDLDGRDEAEKLLVQEGIIFDGLTPRVKTPGGYHLYCATGAPVQSRNAVLSTNGTKPQVDIKGAGGYVIAPPSIHPSGQTYEWETPLSFPLPPAPQALLDLLARIKTKTSIEMTVDEKIQGGRRNNTLTSLGGSMRRRGMSEAAIIAALRAENEARCEPPLDDDEVHDIARSVSRYPPASDVADKNTWPVLKDLPSGLRPVPSIPSDLLPDPIRPWLDDIAERFQCPPEFPAIGTIVALASLVGRRTGIRPKREDNWLVVPNLWGGVIGRPGIMKTPALTESLKPLYRLEAKAHEVFDIAAKEFEARRLLDEVRRKGKINEAAREKDLAKQELLIREAVAAETDPPIRVRYIVNDPTVEKLGELLNQNPSGLLLFRDELTGWLKTLDREGRENDRAFYLEAWDGKGRYTYDRIGRGTLDIEAACVSVLGGIQPGPLEDYLRQAVKGGSSDDGLMQRFQLLVYPDVPREWKNVDRPPNREARDRVYTIFENLDRLNPKDLGATCEDGELPCFRFISDAQGFFDDWRKDLEDKIRADDEHPVMEAHLSKYRSLMPSLALLFHLFDIVSGHNRGPVTKQAAEMAAAWCDFLEEHARRIYQTVTERYQLAARLLGGRIKAGKLPDPFTARDVYLKGWTGLNEPEDVERAAEILEDAGWIKSQLIGPTLKGGRPTVRYSINPDLKVLKAPDMGDAGSSEFKQ